MECFKIEHLSFTYPNADKKTLDDISIVIHNGEFVTICGKSGCGKTTLLRLLKSSLSPIGNVEGRISFSGTPLSDCDLKTQASEIGFVMQSPDNQIVTDKVWHELSFGLESLGCSTPEIRARVSEMASFFGMDIWFHKDVSELSGGQKQKLNLASVMVLQPSVLVLDEPTSQLDPIAAQDFFKTLEKINRELGVTVVITEHRLEEAFPLSDRVIVLDKGKIIADAPPREVGKQLNLLSHDMCMALPTPIKVHNAIPNEQICPLNIREGRRWLETYAQTNEFFLDTVPKDNSPSEKTDFIVEASDVWFRYDPYSADVIKGLDISIRKGEIFAILGGNGVGKTTALSLISGIIKPYRGEIRIKGKNSSKIKDLYRGIIGFLPQNPQSLFVKKTVFLDLMDILSEQKIPQEECEMQIANISSLCCIEHLLEKHPYDLSGGEQQRAALAKVLLCKPEILLLDEPTKGMDAHFKETFANILRSLKQNGITVIMVSHDIEFCAEHADRCAMFFDGNITSVGTPRVFFSGKSFYTTSANRMARTTIPGAVLTRDIILACGGSVSYKQESRSSAVTPHFEKKPKNNPPQKKKRSRRQLIAGSFFLLCFLITSIGYIIISGTSLLHTKTNQHILQIVGIVEIAMSFLCFFPGRELGTDFYVRSNKKNKLSKRTVLAAFFILIAIPFTIFIGSCFFDDRKYYFISTMILIETMIPFCFIFESRKPKARELVVISVLCAITVAGRAIFLTIPQFKPVIALIIIAGICFGGETGFLVGAVSAFISNFIFGQGPWTPWQMVAFGMIGFLAGILFQKGFLRKTKATLCIFGFFATVVIYGGIMNPASIITMQSIITPEMIIFAYLKGLPFDLVHAFSTVFFLWFIAEPMIEKLERVKVKYGMIKG